MASVRRSFPSQTRPLSPCTYSPHTLVYPVFRKDYDSSDEWRSLSSHGSFLRIACRNTLCYQSQKVQISGSSIGNVNGAHSPLDIIAASSFSCLLPFLFLTHPPLLVSRCSLLRLNRFDVHLSLTVFLPRLPRKPISVSLRGAFQSSRRLVASIPHSMPLFSFCIVTFGLMQPPRSSYNEFL